MTNDVRNSYYCLKKIIFFYSTGASDEGGPKVLLRRPHRARAQERQRGLRRYGNAHGDRPKP